MHILLWIIYIHLVIIVICTTMLELSIDSINEDHVVRLGQLVPIYFSVIYNNLLLWSFILTNAQ